MDRGRSLIIPPLFDSANYAYWKVPMRAFLQSLDEKVCQAVEIGWAKPTEAPADWDDAKIEEANFNSKSLNALFSVVMNEEFKKISSTETTKEAWTILQTTYEGTKAVKDSKLQRLTTSFEEIKMEEDESFDKLYAKLKDIVNSAFNLGETIPKPKIVRKVLRSLPERFHAKITTIDGILNAFTATINPTKGIVEDVDEEEDLVDSKFKKMDDQDDIHTGYEKLYKVSEKYGKLYKLATKKLSDVELDHKELSTKFDEANQTIGALRFENNFLAKKTKKLEAELFQVRAQLERASSAKLDEMLSIQKSTSD